MTRVPLRPHRPGPGGVGWGGGRAQAAAAVHCFTLLFFFLTLSSDADQQASTSLLSAGRHQRRRIMRNYNRQSKTKPFTFNELHSEGKGRLPQGGILMKQMAECSQGPTLPVLLFTVCQHFQHSEELHLSLQRSLCAESAGKTILPINALERRREGAAIK